MAAQVAEELNIKNGHIRYWRNTEEEEEEEEEEEQSLSQLAPNERKLSLVRCLFPAIGITTLYYRQEDKDDEATKASDHSS